jgi:hypothetical protein
MCLLEGIQDITAHLGEDEKLKGELQHLGLLQDLVLYLEEMQSEGDEHKRWPRLKHISIYRIAPFGQSVEKEAERLIDAGKVDMVAVAVSNLRRRMFALGVFVVIAVLVVVLNLPTWSLWVLVLYFFVPEEGKRVMLLGRR